MKAPEKLYVDAEDRLGDSILYGFTEKRKDDDIEYIRKDAFIKNTCEWLKENFLFDEAGYCKTNIYSTKSMIYNFKNTLGGEI